MKTLKLLNFCLLVIAALLLVTTVSAFAKGDITNGICNIHLDGVRSSFLLGK